MTDKRATESKMGSETFPVYSIYKNVNRRDLIKSNASVSRAPQAKL